MKNITQLIKVFTVGFLALIAVASCSSRKDHSPFPSIDQTAKAEIAQPVNCNTARGDIQILEQERASVGSRIVDGVRSVFPIAAVVGILSGDYSERVEVASGQYNDDINNKIAQIRSTCNIA